MVETIDETNRFPHAPELARTITQLAEELGAGDRTVTIVLLDDEAMANYNLRYRGAEGATDVLSFPTREPDEPEVPEVEHLGDILISVDTAQRQAVRQGHGLLDEVVELAAHGLTHLRGFDHQTEESWQTFREAQQRALTLLRAAR